jgi:hypothetical protein
VLRHLDRKTGFTFISAKGLATDLGYLERSVRRMLEEMRWLVLIVSREGGGRGKATEHAFPGLLRAPKTLSEKSGNPVPGDTLFGENPVPEIPNDPQNPVPGDSPSRRRRSPGKNTMPGGGAKPAMLQLPSDWQPTAETVAQCKQLGMSGAELADLIADFRHQFTHREPNRRMTLESWQAEIVHWARKRRSRPAKPNGATHQQRSQSNWLDKMRKDSAP